LNPTRFERDDLLDDARFWALLYEYWVKPRVGDRFEDGERYFFGVRESDVNALFHKLEKARTPQEHYPEYSVLLTLRNGWRIGVVLSMYPEDFEIQDVVARPASDELIVFGVNGGNSRLPALRWEELLELREAVVPNTPALKAKVVLLFFPAICLSSKMKIDEVRQVSEQAWIKSGIPIEHASELVGRPIEDFLGSRQLYPDVEDTVWSRHRKHGWINDSRHSLRNPNFDGSERVIPPIRELFSTLEGGA
jgi:hypothetical protein